MNSKSLLHRTFIFILGFGISFGGFAAPLTISELPLSTSSYSEPNVMLLLDSSGSMNSLNWPSDFDPNTNYPEWCDNCTGTTRWRTDNNRMLLSAIGGDNGDITPSSINNFNGTGVRVECATLNSPAGPGHHIMGRLNDDRNKVKCLFLPDPAPVQPPNVPNGVVVTTAYDGNYLNYLFSEFGVEVDISGVTGATPSPFRISTTDLTTDAPRVSNSGNTVTIPVTTRLTAVSNITTGLVTQTSGVNFGLFQFNAQQGGQIIADCGGVDANNVANLLSTNYIPNDFTPLGEALYEVTRYFRGWSSQYNTNGGNDYNSPITDVCQKNFTILLTDGQATSDLNIPVTEPTSDTPECTINPNNCIRDISPARYANNNNNNIPALEDVAGFGYMIDMYADPASPPELVQNMHTLTVGYALNSTNLIEAARLGNGGQTGFYFQANNEADLLSSLREAIKEIKVQSSYSSAAAASTSTGSLTAGSNLFLGAFDPRFWIGHLQRIPIESDGSILVDQDGVPIPDVKAETWLDSQTDADMAKRNIFTYNTDTNTGVPFTASNLSTAQLQQLKPPAAEGVNLYINYLRGDKSCEVSNNPAAPDCEENSILYKFRDRDSRLGTIVNSSPLYIPNPQSIYPKTWGTNAPENPASESDPSTYRTFKKSHSNRRHMIYVGANDGMLHAFDAQSNRLEEKFAYIPSIIYPKLAAYGNTTFIHNYYVDASPTVVDAYTTLGGGSWRTILVGGLGKGGQGIYALDITHPETFSANNILWEFSDADDRDMGYSYSTPAIARMHHGKWTAMFGNGLNNTELNVGSNFSASGTAKLYIRDISDGSIVKTIDTKIGRNDDPRKLNRPNGLASVVPVDLDSDMIIDYIYAGDFFGNLWRFDVTDSDPANWGVFGKNGDTDGPIFIAESATGSQPIVTRPDVARAGNKRIMLYFGTGVYLEESDKINTDVQSFYGLLDDPENDKQNLPARVTRSTMKQQSFVNTQATFTNPDNSTKYTETVRIFTNNVTPQSTYKNWFVDLVSVSGPAEGERVVTVPLVRGSTSTKRVIFVSIIPSNSACGFGGSSWLIELNARNGNRTDEPVFDLNYDGKLSNLDNSAGNVYNGWSQEGIQTNPTIVVDKNREHKYMSSSSGGVKKITEALPDKRGRQSWRQIK